LLRTLYSLYWLKFKIYNVGVLPYGKGVKKNTKLLSTSYEKFKLPTGSSDSISKGINCHIETCWGTNRKKVEQLERQTPLCWCKIGSYKFSTKAHRTLHDITLLSGKCF
jgi:hypothetical protein